MIGWVGASLAVAFAVRTLLVVFFDRPAYVFPDPLPFRRIADGGYGLVAAAIVWFDPRPALAAGIALGLIRATVTSAHVGNLELGPAYRDMIPLALGLAHRPPRRRRSQPLPSRTAAGR